MQKVILGLDVSTTTIGWSLITLEGFLIEIGYIPLGKLENLFIKALELENVLLEIKKRYEIKWTFIEEDLKRFKNKASSASTIQKLSRFNGMASLIVYQVTSNIPEAINVTTARQLIGCKTSKKDDTPIKEQVFSWVRNYLGESVIWPTKTLKSGPRKGEEILVDECLDMSDSFVIALAGFKQLYEKNDL